MYLLCKGTHGVRDEAMGRGRVLECHVGKVEQRRESEGKLWEEQCAEENDSVGPSCDKHSSYTLLLERVVSTKEGGAGGGFLASSLCLMDDFLDPVPNAKSLQLLIVGEVEDPKQK
jgi:hypothetical protein